MKCSYCGNELEKGAEFCPECGMILGLNEEREDKTSSKEEPTFTVPEYTPNVFRAIDDEEETAKPAMELEADEKEEVVPVTENIPEFVSEVPEYIPAKVSDFEDISSFSQDAEAFEEEEASDGNEAQDEAEEMAEEIFEENSEEQAEEEIVLAAPEYTPAPDLPKEDELKIRVPENEITYPEYETYKNDHQENEVITPTEEEYEEIDADDIYVEPSKKKGGLAVFLVVALICIVIGGVYAVKNIIPVSSGTENETTTTKNVQAGVVGDETTEDSAEDTTEEETTEAEDTTEAEETTEAEDTTEEQTTTEAETTEAESSIAEETTETDETETSADVTTTQAASTTKAPTTTQAPATTKAPTTTKAPATTTDPYGINDVAVKEPSKYLSKTYTLYCTDEGVILRNKPSSSAERILYLSKGADLTVYAKENGYYYVRSNRYGVKGWVSSSYTSESRPVEETTKVYKNTVQPDKKYDKVQIKYTTDGLNIRKGPGTDYDVISLIPIDYPVKVIGYKKGVSGWAYVTDTTYGISGWVSTAYIK